MIAWEVAIEERRLWQARVIARSHVEAIAIVEEMIDDGHHDLEAYNVFASPDPTQFYGPAIPAGYDWYRKEIR